MSATDKHALRAYYRALRDQLTPEQRKTEEREICSQIICSDAYAMADSVLLYAARGSEIDLSLVAVDAWAAGKVVAYPRCLDRSGHMAFFAVASPEQLVEGTFGILEPDTFCLPVQPSGNALCIVPALAVDVKGNRLGYGKGYYDRFLAEFEGITACAAYAACIAKELPHDGYDLPVQMIITGKEACLVDTQDEMQKDTEPLIINDDMSEGHGFASVEDYGLLEDEDDGYEADDGYELEDFSEADGVDTEGDLRQQRFMYRWRRIPLLGKLPFDPVLLLVLGNFALLLLSRLIDVLLIDRDNEYLAVVLLQILIFIIPGYLFLRFRGKGYAKRLRLRAPKPEHIFLIAGATGALITGGFLLSVLMGNLSEGQSFVLYDTFTSRHDGSISGMIYLVLAYAVLPAVCEELIFRSILCAEFEGKGVACAVLVSSVLFSMLHFNLLALPVYLFAGVVLALTMYATRSVFAVMIVHFLYNLFCLFGQSGFADFYVTQSATTLFSILMIAALLLSLAILFGECSRLYRAYATQGLSDEYKPTGKQTGGQLIRHTALAFASPGAILCVLLYMIICILN